MLKFRYAAGSDVGQVRASNEDSGFAGPYLLLVADGVGGAAAGEIASASTAYVASAISMVNPDPNPLEVLRETVEVAHQHLRTGVDHDPARAGMSTTLTAVLSDGEQFALCHIGDSRAYLLRDQQLIQITRDQTLVQAMIDAGQLTDSEAKVHPYRSVVLQALDAQHRPEPDLVPLDLQVGDRLLLCSDGLSDLVSKQQLARCLADDDLDAAVDSLIDQALAAGGRDNITCVVGEVEEGEAVRRHGVMVGAVRSPVNLINGAAVRMGPGLAADGRSVLNGAMWLDRSAEPIAV